MARASKCRKTCAFHPCGSCGVARGFEIHVKYVISVHAGLEARDPNQKRTGIGAKMSPKSIRAATIIQHGPELGPTCHQNRLG